MDRQAFMEHYKTLDRALFLDKDLQNMATYDRPLPIGHGQTISQPSLVAQMTIALNPEPSSRVLEIGTGQAIRRHCWRLFAKQFIPLNGFLNS